MLAPIQKWFDDSAALYVSKGIVAMAKIVLGMASSHAPQLAMPPEQWRSYGDRSRTQNNHWYQGKTYSFDELVDLRAESHFDQECTDDKFQSRYDACQRAIKHLAHTLDTVKPDLAIILGDDQHEAFVDDNNALHLHLQRRHPG